MSKLKRGSIAFLLSYLVPGLGHIYNGQILVGVSIGLGFLASGFLAVSVRLLFAFRTAFAYLIAGSILVLAIAIQAAVVAVRQVKNDSVPRLTWRPCTAGALLLCAAILAHTGSPDRLLPVRAFKMPTKSMSPTIVEGDRIIADMGYYKTHQPNRGDVVVFKMPVTDVLYTKRIIAIGGDTIEGSPGVAILNGRTLSEPYAIHDPDESPYDGETFGPVKIPASEIFVMGDNRDDSYDSREYGPFDVSRVVGKPLYIYYSRDDKSRIGRAIR
jgi:signal peptidase I